MTQSCMCPTSTQTLFYVLCTLDIFPKLSNTVDFINYKANALYRFMYWQPRLSTHTSKRILKDRILWEQETRQIN